MLEVRLLHDEARHAARALEAQALHDALTGLANRRLLTDRISAMLANARRNKGSMAVVFLDLDDFKHVNDTQGHLVGDTLLKMVAGRLSAAVREEDTVARLGGDEFVVALWDVKRADDATAVASKLIKSVSTPYAIEGESISATASAGIAVYPDHGADCGRTPGARRPGAVRHETRRQERLPRRATAGGAGLQLD
jgi:diguanylate cyclase (GGDEF)-like protein